MQGFISEDDRKTFEGWLKDQGVDATTTAAEELARWRAVLQDARARSASQPNVGLMKLPPAPSEYRYAVAVREWRRRFWLIYTQGPERRETVRRCWPICNNAGGDAVTRRQHRSTRTIPSEANHAAHPLR